MSEPIITKRERYSDTMDMLTMSDDSILWGCTWPKCNFVSPNKESVPRHYRQHSGLAAQRRRAQRRPRSAVVINEVLEAALALLDMTQDLVNKLDAFDTEFTEMRKQIEEHAVDVEELLIQIEVNREKAEAYDQLMAAYKRVVDHDAP